MTSHDRLRVLHVIMAARETSGQYNEHCLPMADRREIGLCTYLAPQVYVPEAISLFPGDGTVRGFWAALRRGLDDRPWDVVHVHAAPLGVLFMLAAAGRRGLRRRSVYTVQNSFTSYKLRNQLLLFPVFAFFARVVLCSEAVRDSLPRPLRALARRRLDVVPNAVDTERVDATLAQPAALEQPAARPADGFTVASVGRLIPIKNPETVVEAFHRGAGADARLLFVGDGLLRAAVEGAAARLGIAERVSITGLVPRDDVYRNVSGADVVVSASSGEGLPVAVLEAMACGVPVVLSDIQPHREIAAGADFIPLVAPGDVDGFAREIAGLRDMGPEGRRRLGAACRKVVDDRFSLAAMHDRLASIYGAVADGGGGPRRRQPAGA